MSLLGHDRVLQKYWRDDIRQLSGGSTAAWPPATDHGTLTGLGDDDHAIYLNTTRHDTITRHGPTVLGSGAASTGTFLRGDGAWAAQSTSATDADAIHINLSSEISALTEKTSPSTGDLLVIEDSTSSNAKRRVQIGNLPSGSTGGGSVATDAIWDALGDLAVGTGADTASRLAVGSNGQVPIATSTEATGIKWGKGPTNGQGLVHWCDYSAIGQGDWAPQITASSDLGSYLRQATPGDGDNISYEVYLPAGTYTFALEHHKNTSAGKVDVSIDGAAAAGTIDLYAALTWNVVSTIAGISIAATGLHTVRFLVNGKNASSSGYAAYVVWFSFWKTA